MKFEKFRLRWSPSSEMGEAGLPTIVGRGKGTSPVFDRPVDVVDGAFHDDLAELSVPSSRPYVDDMKEFSTLFRGSPPKPSMGDFKIRNPPSREELTEKLLDYYKSGHRAPTPI